MGKMWKDLSMSQRAKVIQMAVKAGLRDLDNIRSFYNESIGSSKEAHFDDKYKTVYHPTFSTQSKYSGIIDSKFNPQGLVGGTWSKDNHTFTMSPDGYRGPVNMDERKAYLINAENNGVQLREADGSLPVYDNIIWGGVLPAATVKSRRFEVGGHLYAGGRGHKYLIGGYTDGLPEGDPEYTPATLAGWVTSLFTDDTNTISKVDIGSAGLNMSADAIPVFGNAVGAVISVGDVLYDTGKLIAHPSWSNLGDFGGSLLSVIPGVSIKEAKSIDRASAQLIRNAKASGLRKAAKSTVTHRKVGRPKTYLNQLDKAGNIRRIGTITLPKKKKVLGTVANTWKNSEDMYQGWSEWGK